MFKDYIWELACIAGCAALLTFRPWPGVPVFIIACAILAGSAFLTYEGEKDETDDMWWRMAISALAFLIIGIAQG